MTAMQRRKWVPDVQAIAAELIKEHRDARQEYPDDPLEAQGQGDLEVIGTLESWRQAAEFHGEEFTEDDWIGLVQELARRAAE